MIYNNDLTKAYLYKRNNDKWYIDIREPLKRLRLSLHTEDRLTALPKGLEIVKNYINGIVQTPTFEKVANDWLKTIQKPSTLKFHQGRLNAVFFKAFKGMKINEIKSNHIRDIIDKRLTEVKPISVNKEMSTLSQIFQYAVQKIYIKEAPFIEHLKEDTCKRDAFTYEEIEEILTTAEQRVTETNHPRIQFDRTILYYFIKFLCLTGIRNKEARSIKFKGIGEDTAKLTSSKTIIREVFLSDEALKIVELLKQTYDHFGINYDDNSYIFQNFKGEQLGNSKKAFNNLLSVTSMADRLGKNELTQYSFRHYYITNAIKKGVPLTTIAIQCGNSVKMIQSNYNHLTIHSVKNQLK